MSVNSVGNKHGSSTQATQQSAPVEEKKPRGDRDRGDRDRGDRDRGGRNGGRERGGRDSGPRISDASPEAEEVSFEDSFDAEVAAEFGDLGPAGDDRPRSGGDDGGRRRRRRR